MSGIIWTVYPTELESCNKLFLMCLTRHFAKTPVMPLLLFFGRGLFAYLSFFVFIIRQ